MKLSDNEIQRLKNNEMKIRELRVAHFVDSDELEVENILKLLNKNILDIQELSTLLKNGNEYRRLLESRELFKELSESDKLTEEDLKYLFDKIDKEYEFYALRNNTHLMKHFIDHNIVSFQELVDKYKSMKDYANDSCLDELIDTEELFKELIRNNLLNEDDLKYLLNKIDHRYELSSLSRNTYLLTYMIDNDLFRELVDRFKSIGGLYKLLDNKELFEELIENSKLTNEDFRYLLKKTDNIYEITNLCENTSLTKQILKEFILNKEDVDKFNKVVEDENIHIRTIFNLIESHHKDNEKILKLNELNRYVYRFDFDKEQKLELAGILKDNEQAQRLLKQLVDNNLLDQYSFDRLKNLLTKNEKKQKLKMNF